MRASPHWTLSHWSKFLPVSCSGVVLLLRCVHHLALTYRRSGSIVPRAYHSGEKRRPNGMLCLLSGRESLFQLRCCYACVQVINLMTLLRWSSGTVLPTIVLSVAMRCSLLFCSSSLSNRGLRCSVQVHLPKWPIAFPSCLSCQ